MSALAFSDFDGLPDALTNHRFEILINPPNAGGANRDLALRCQQISIPGSSVEQMIVAIHGYEYVFPGRRIYPKTMAASFIETADGSVNNRVRGWMESVRGTESGSSSDYKHNVVTVGTLNVFDVTGQQSLQFLVDNLWPQDFTDMQLDSTNAAAYLQAITFSYDRVRYQGIEIK